MPAKLFEFLPCITRINDNNICIRPSPSHYSIKRFVRCLFLFIPLTMCVCVCVYIIYIYKRVYTPQVINHDRFRVPLGRLKYCFQRNERVQASLQGSVYIYIYYIVYSEQKETLKLCRGGNAPSHSVYGRPRAYRLYRYSVISTRTHNNESLFFELFVLFHLKCVIYYRSISPAVWRHYGGAGRGGPGHLPRGLICEWAEAFKSYEISY